MASATPTTTTISTIQTANPLTTTTTSINRPINIVKPFNIGII